MINFVQLQGADLEEAKKGLLLSAQSCLTALINIDPEGFLELLEMIKEQAPEDQIQEVINERKRILKGGQ